MAKDKAPFGKSLPFWSLNGRNSHGNTMSKAAFGPHHFLRLQEIMKLPIDIYA